MSFLYSLVLLVIVLLILGFGLYVLFYRKRRLSKKEINNIRKLWREIVDIRDQHPEQAILKADKLFDFALKKAGYSGSMGEKLRGAKAIFSDNDGLWSAHKLRNRIAHEVNIQIKEKQAKFALKAFKKAFFDLGINL